MPPELPLIAGLVALAGALPRTERASGTGRLAVEVLGITVGSLAVVWPLWAVLWWVEQRWWAERAAF